MKKIKTTLPPYSCSLSNFWIGYLDWKKEQNSPNQKSITNKKPSLEKLAITILFLFLILAVITLTVSTFAPEIVTGLRTVGTDGLALMTYFLMAGIAAIILAIPVVTGIRVFKFTKQMCLRGYHLKLKQTNLIL